MARHQVLLSTGMLLLTEDISLNDRQVKSLLHNNEKSAEAVNLLYVSDSQPGIRRIKRGKKFIYLSGSKQITNTETLIRIKSLVIPPAWQNVWICSEESGHLQATGTDLRKRKQYKYHPLWNTLRNHTKFYRMRSMGKMLPLIRKKLEHDLALPGMPREKVLALVVSLMQQTSIRVGNNLYEKLYGSYGLTTLKDKHVKINGSKMQFMFKGKKGVAQNIDISNKRLAKIVRQCRDIPGQELFQYYDENGHHKSIDSGMVNAYLKNISGSDFTAKDFRTWCGTLHALHAFKQLGDTDKKSSVKKNIVSVLDYVAKQLGNTRTVCKKYYVHPVLITLYENNKLQKYIRKENFNSHSKTGLTPEEQLMMKILEARI